MIGLKDDKPKLIERADIENLKNILTAEELTSNEKQRVKVAFAEGYIAGNDKKSSGRGFKWMKFIQQLIFTVVAFTILISLAGVYQS